jgi:hypothetical protein
MKRLLFFLLLLTSLAKAQTPLQQFWLLNAANTCGVSDNDACTYIQALQLTGVSLSQTQINAIDTFFRDIKGQPNPNYTTVNYYSKLAVFYPMIGGTAASHAINAKSPSAFTIIWNGTVTHDANGEQTTGDATSYGTTSYIPRGKLSMNNTHLAIYNRTNITGGFALGGRKADGTESMSFNPGGGTGGEVIADMYGVVNVCPQPRKHL